MQNFIHRAVVTCPSNELTKEFVREQLLSNTKEKKTIVLDKVPRLREIEKEVILYALETTDGDKREAAYLLGITPRTIYNKLKEYAKEGVKVDKFGNVFQG